MKCTTVHVRDFSFAREMYTHLFQFFLFILKPSRVIYLVFSVLHTYVLRMNKMWILFCDLGSLSFQLSKIKIFLISRKYAFTLSINTGGNDGGKKYIYFFLSFSESPNTHKNTQIIFFPCYYPLLITIYTS